jgi:hypothetical protein
MWGPERAQRATPGNQLALSLSKDTPTPDTSLILRSS